MFIKVKLETNNLEESISKTDSCFELHNEDTVWELRVQLERFIKTPAEHQVIKTLTKKLKRDEKLYDVLEMADQTNGVTLMLHRRSEQAEAVFLCFLLLYRDKQTALVLEAQDEANKAKFVNANNPKSSVIVVESSDDDVSSSSSSDSYNSSTGSHNSSVSKRKRRLNTPPTAIKLKIRKVDSTFTALRSYLDGNDEIAPNRLFLANDPVASEKQTPEQLGEKESNTVTVHVSAASPVNPCGEEDRPPYATVSPENREYIAVINKTSPVNPCEEEDRPPNATVSPEKRENIADISKTSPVNPCEEEDRPPYATVSPEKREYIAVISKGNTADMTNSLNQNESEELMDLFFARFLLDSNFSAQLSFVQTTSPVVLFNDVVWIACDNDKTFQWVNANTKCFPQHYTYKVHSFLDYIEARECIAIIPGSLKTRNLDDIFALLEKQNPRLNTTQWAVKSRRLIAAKNDQYAEKVVSQLCNNEVLHIFIDRQSQELMREKFDFKLSYCFWKVTFELMNSN